MKRLFTNFKLKEIHIIRILYITLFIQELIGVFYIQYPSFHISETLNYTLIISIFFSSFILLIFIAFSEFLKINNRIPFYLVFLILLQHIFLLVYNFLSITNFWQYIVVEFQVIMFLSILIVINTLYLLNIIWISYFTSSKINLHRGKLKEEIGKLSGWLVSIGVYIPILAGILTPMTIFFPLAYVSWIIISFISPGSFYNSWFVIASDDLIQVSIIIILECCVFILGLYIFLSGLIQLAKGRKNDLNVVQKGTYRYVRHPQNLGILIMMLPLTFYIPGFNDLGIRIADLLSWILFCLIIILICDYEERVMMKRFPSEYASFKSKTGFLIPKIRKQKLISLKSIRYRYVLRYFILFLCYILIVIATNFIAGILYSNGIIEIYR